MARVPLVDVASDLSATHATAEDSIVQIWPPPDFTNDHDWPKIVWSQARTYHTETSEAGTITKA